MDWGALFSAVGTVGGIGGITTLILLWPRFRKLRADTRRVDVDSALAVDVAQDAAWQRIIEVQTEALLSPMRAELKRQGDRITDLEIQLTAARAKYWLAIRWIRQALTWISRWHPNSRPEPPALPAEIQADV